MGVAARTATYLGPPLGNYDGHGDVDDDAKCNKWYEMCTNRPYHQIWFMFHVFYFKASKQAKDKMHVFSCVLIGLFSPKDSIPFVTESRQGEEVILDSF